MGVDVTAAYSFDGIYLPSEVSSYLSATMPPESRPPTTRSLYRWIRTGLLAKARQSEPGRSLVVAFEDLVSCQAITILRRAGLSLQEVRKAERLFADLLGVASPFAHRQFWYSGADVFMREGAFLTSGTRSGQMAADFIREWMKPLPRFLTFAPATDIASQWEPQERIALRPEVQFGQPCLLGTRIPTRSLWSYYKGGDSVAYLADSYGIEVTDVERAIAWEERVHAAASAHAALPARQQPQPKPGGRAQPR